MTIPPSFRYTHNKRSLSKKVQFSDYKRVAATKAEAPTDAVAAKANAIAVAKGGVAAKVEVMRRRKEDGREWKKQQQSMGRRSREENKRRSNSQSRRRGGEDTNNNRP